MSRRNTLRSLALGFLAAATLVGCGSEDKVGGSPTSTDTQATTSALDPGDICKGGETAPFTVEELLEGMRAAGYDMYVDPGCNLEVASWRLSNTSVRVPELGPEDFARARAREGAIACNIVASAEGVGPTVTKKKFEDENHTRLAVLNVSCNIVPDPAKMEEQIARLERTLNELAISQA